MDLDSLLGPVETVLDLVPTLGPWVGGVIAALVVITIVSSALKPRRIPYRKRDQTRLFPWSQKKQLIAVAGGRCEHKHPLWRRCPRRGSEADHIIPWSRGGRTVLENGQLLCRKHNKRKSDTVPSHLYRWRLKQRRRRYR